MVPSILTACETSWPHLCRAGGLRIISENSEQIATTSDHNCQQHKLLPSRISNSVKSIWDKHNEDLLKVCASADKDAHMRCFGDLTTPYVQISELWTAKDNLKKYHRVVDANTKQQGPHAACVDS